MGRIEKDGAEVQKAAVEEPEIVTQMKAVEKKYLELEQEYERKMQQLVLEYTAKQQPLLDERKKVLCGDGTSDGPPGGTPACAGFWFEAFSNHPAVGELIQEWDEPVLQYLEDVEYSHVDDEDSNKGFKLKLTFRENPYLTTTILEKTVESKLDNPFCGQKQVLSITCSSVEWKEGKDVTVQMVAKKVKGGGAKKAKQKKEKEEPRPSFFRDFFRDLHPQMKLPDDARDLAAAIAEGEESDEEQEEEDDDDETMIARLMDFDFEAGSAIKDDIVPRAIRWYTGEAAPEEDDEDDEEEEEEDDEDDSEEEEESPAPRGRGGGKGAAAKRKGKPSPQSSPETKPKEAPKEECKQQ